MQVVRSSTFDPLPRNTHITVPSVFTSTVIARVPEQAGNCRLRPKGRNPAGIVQMLPIPPDPVNDFQNTDRRHRPWSARNHASPYCVPTLMFVSG